MVNDLKYLLAMRQRDERLLDETSDREEIISKDIKMNAGKAREAYQGVEFPRKVEINEQQRLD